MSLEWNTRPMKITLVIFLLAAVLATGAEPVAYEGYEKDRVLLRDNSRLTKPVLNASSDKACQAARRLFSKVSLVGMARQQVLAILGDPKTISDYGIPAGSAPDSPLTYRFDTGFGGWEYVIEFRDGIVTSVKENGIE